MLYPTHLLIDESPDVAAWREALGRVPVEVGLGEVELGGWGERPVPLVTVRGERRAWLNVRRPSVVALRARWMHRVLAADGARLVATFRPTGDERELETPFVAVALAVAAGGRVLHTHRAVPAAEAMHELQRRHERLQAEARRRAERDAALTDRRCPHCGLPCFSYRRVCRACHRPVSPASPRPASPSAVPASAPG